MVERWECTEDDYVVAFGEAVIDAFQRPETRDKASSHDEGEAQCGMMVVTQSKWCHEIDETARVRRVRRRVPSEARLKQVAA